MIESALNKQPNTQPVFLEYEYTVTKDMHPEWQSALTAEHELREVKGAGKPVAVASGCCRGHRVA